MASKLPPVAHVTAADGATSALFSANVDGTLAPGSHLRLNELAEQFGLSMMPVREALRRLEHLGLVLVEPHRGAFVREMTLEDLTATYETRFLLEGEAAYLAAMGVPESVGMGAVRFSLGRVTTEAEIDAVVGRLGAIMVPSTST